jgi:hypothetical protein
MRWGAGFIQDSLPIMTLQKYRDASVRINILIELIICFLVSPTKGCRAIIIIIINVGKPKEKRPLGRPRRRWVDNIKMDLGETGWEGGDWIELAQDRDQWRALVNTVMNLRVP